MAASTSQAKFAANVPDRRWASEGVLQVGVDLFDDRVAAVVGLGRHERARRIGEHGMVARDPQQFTFAWTCTRSGLASRTGARSVVL